MKKFIYAGIICVAILLASYFLMSYLENVEIAKETEMMNKELSFILEENEAPQDIYLNVDTLLEKYPKADVKFRDSLKDFRDFFEGVYDFQQKYNASFKNTARMTISSISALFNGENSPFDEMNAELRRLEKKQKELNFHLKEVGVYLCDKYRIDCKKEEKKSESEAR